MPASGFLQRFLGSRTVRRVADRFFLSYARRRRAEIDTLNLAKTQEETLIHLVRRAEGTRFGRDHDFARIRAIRDYQRLVRLRTYEDFWREYWQPAFPNLGGVSWPDPIPYYALSSGTTSGTTKNIPVSWDMVQSNKKAGLTLLSGFLCSRPDAHLLHGQLFFLGGSTQLVPLVPSSPSGRQNGGEGAYPLAGDLSGIAAREVPAWFRPYSYPPLDLALLSDWEEKVRVFAADCATKPIALVGGVPSWLLILFDRLKQVTGKERISEIWPTLRLVIHGGVKFDPYRDLFKQQIGSDKVGFVESYPCSEGFIACEDPRHELLRLIPDHGIFFEFVPVAELAADRPTRHTVANLEVGVQYAVVVTTCAGLWSYVIGDTIAFESRDPPLLRFTGRTKYYLSAFGEHLISEEVEKAVAAAARNTHATVVDFHVGPVFPATPGGLGKHRYVVEFANDPPAAASFVRALDEHLCELNDDYRAHRTGGVGMDAPELLMVRRGAFADWMRSLGKLGGQHKVPRMDNTGRITSQMSDWMRQQGLEPCAE
jgi:hypothetical protein